MASQKLTNSDRDFIVKNITNPIKEKIQKLLEEYGSLVDVYLVGEIPNEVREFCEKYPRIAKKQSHLEYTSLFTKRQWIYLSIPVSEYFPGYFEDENQIYELLNKLPLTEEFKKNVESLLSKQNQLKNKTRCVLEHINTTKQLKDQFPEAYSILMDLSEKEITKCDSTESLRAELSRMMK